MKISSAEICIDGVEILLRDCVKRSRLLVNTSSYKEYREKGRKQRALIGFNVE